MEVEEEVVGAGELLMHDHDFRQRYAPDETTLIESCEVEVHLLPNHKQARYQYTYSIVVTEGEPQNEWFHVIPSAVDHVSFIGARDKSGSLQAKYEKQNDSQTKVTINYRGSLSVGNTYSFSFSYEARIISLPFSQFFSRSLVYTDSFYHINPCNKLLIKVHLPDKCSVIESTPPADKSSNPTVNHEVGKMRPLDDFTFLLAYKQNRIGKELWIGVGFAFLSAILGWLLSKVV